MGLERPSQTTRDILQQGAVQLVLLTVALVLVNRLARDVPWTESVWRSLRFAVPFTLVYSAVAYAMQRGRER